MLGESECFCGCARKVPRRFADVNIRLGETALELLAWDRYRTLGESRSSERLEIDRIVAAGAECHQRLLATVHGGDDDGALPSADAWLADSKERWTERPSMVERGSFFGRRRLRLTEVDFARLDRIHPELSFSGDGEAAAESGPHGQPEQPERSLVEGLERLGSLHRQGLLSEAEFETAKAQLLAHDREAPPHPD